MKRAKLGSVEFSVVSSENITHDADVTEKPVEQGQDIADHVKPKPLLISLRGVIVGDSAASSLQQLYKYQNEGGLLQYVGRSSNGNMVIESFNTDHNADVKNGFAFNLTIKKVRVATGKQVEVTVSPITKKPSPKTNTQVKSKTNKGKQQTQQKSVSNEAKGTSINATNVYITVGERSSLSDLNINK